MVLYRKRSVFAAKIESSPGTGVSLAGADGVFNAYDMELQQTKTVTQREAQGSFGKIASSVGGNRGTYTFRVDLSWAGDTAALPTWATVLLPACGYVDNGSGVFTPRSEAPGNNVKTVTLGKYMSGKYKRLVGASGSFRIVGVAGDPIFIEFNFEGVWETETDTALIEPSYPATKPWKLKNAVTTYNSVNWCIANLTFDAGNELYLEECANSAQGYAKAIITDRVPIFTTDPESVLVATQDRYGIFSAETENAFSLTLIGDADSTITIAAPKAQITAIEDGERNKIAIDNITLQCNKNGSTADQDVSITFAEAA